MTHTERLFASICCLSVLMLHACDTVVTWSELAGNHATTDLPTSGASEVEPRIDLNVSIDRRANDTFVVVEPRYRGQSVNANRGDASFLVDGVPLRLQTFFSTSRWRGPVNSAAPSVLTYRDADGVSDDIPLPPPPVPIEDSRFDVVPTNDGWRVQASWKPDGGSQPMMARLVISQPSPFSDTPVRLEVTDTDSGELTILLLRLTRTNAATESRAFAPGPVSIRLTRSSARLLDDSELGPFRSITLRQTEQVRAQLHLND